MGDGAASAALFQGTPTRTQLRLMRDNQRDAPRLDEAERYLL